MRKETCFDENYVECSEIFDKGWVPKENYYLIRYEPENEGKKKGLCNETNSQLSLKYCYT